MENRNPVILPINVQAICHGKSENNHFVEADTDFSALPTENNYVHAPISSTFINQPFKTQISLVSGVHLHWTLPEALNHGHGSEKDEVSIKFPAAPDHWLVTRIMKSQEKLSYKHWIIESNFISATQPSGSGHSSVIPFKPYKKDEETPFRYLGRCMELEDWKPPGSYPKDKYLKEVSTVGCEQYTELHFGSYYPSSGSVFGFHDKLEQIGNAELSYCVTGWYHDPQNDFLRKFKDFVPNAEKKDSKNQAKADPDILKEFFGWDTGHFHEQGQNPAFSLYNGLVKDIQWKGHEQQYLTTNFSEVKVALGDTQEEAFAALLADKTKPEEREKTEKLFNLLQAGLYQQMGDTNLKRLEAGLHETRFTAQEQGTKWRIDPQAEADQSKLKPLPDAVAPKLAKLNSMQQALEKQQNKIETLQEQAYADWCKYIYLDYENKHREEGKMLPLKSIKPKGKDERLQPLKVKDTETGDDIDKTSDFKDYNLEAEHILDFLYEKVTPSWKNMTSDYAENQNVLFQYQSDLEKYLARECSQYQLKPGSVAPFYEAREPAVAIALSKGKNWMYGAHRNKLSGKNLLTCRFPEHLPTGSVDPLPEVQLKTGTKWPARWAWKMDVLQKLVQEATVVAYATPSRGKPPSTFARTKWKGNPFLPLFLQWQIEMVSKEEGPVKNFGPEFATKNFSLKGPEIHYKNWKLYDKFKPYIAGVSPMVPGIVEHVNGLIRDGNKRSGKQIPKLTDQKVVLAQELDGFNLSMLMKYNWFNMGVIDMLTDSPEHKEIKAMVGDRHNSFPDLYDSLKFLPIRNGIFRITKLRLVDAFGRFQDIGKEALKKTIYASGMKLSQDQIEQIKVVSNISFPEDKYPAYFSPRLTQPARLTFRMLTHIPKNPIADWSKQFPFLTEVTSHPDSNPVCGWLLPNYFDRSLALYDAHGNPLGALRALKATKTVQWDNVPGDGLFDRPIKDALQLADPKIRGFALKIFQEPFNYLNDLLDALFASRKYYEPDGEPRDLQLANLMGTPLALIRTTLQMELDGLPATDQSWGATIVDIFKSGEELETDVTKRADRKLTAVKFPLQLGDHDHFRDGLVGFFKENNKGKADFSRFYLSFKPDQNNSGKIEETQNLSLAPNSKTPLTLTLILDPRLPVHATTGVLPTASVELDPEMYQQALKKIKTTFFVNPILSDPGRVALPLPQLEDHDWTWIEQTPSKSWHQQNKLLPPGPALNSNTVMSEGWLQLKTKK